MSNGRIPTVRKFLLFAVLPLLSLALSLSARAQYTDRQAIDDLGGRLGLAVLLLLTEAALSILFTSSSQRRTVLGPKRSCLPLEGRTRFINDSRKTSTSAVGLKGSMHGLPIVQVWAGILM